MEKERLSEEKLAQIKAEVQEMSVSDLKEITEDKRYDHQLGHREHHKRQLAWLRLAELEGRV